MTEPYLIALIGGVCIGLASVLLMILTGRIAGISGITFTAVSSPRKNIWAILFIVGLMLGAFLYHLLSGAPIPNIDISLPYLLGGGFIVGMGTKLGSGCTSGHGICGIGRLSTRSIIATCTFMIFGMISVYMRLHGAAS
jgi:uncharacterized membrane protein YedE/YeeE